MKYHRDICKVGKDWMKGQLQECVADADGNVVCVCGDDGDMADRIATALTFAPPPGTGDQA